MVSHDQAPTASDPAVTIDIVSDVVCPWCYVGKRRLEQALAQQGEAKVDIHWRPFQLDPTIPEAGVDRQTYLERKFGGTQRVSEIHERITEAGREVGIAFAFDRIRRSPNTLDAHRLIRWARSVGRQDDVIEALFRLYFVDGADIGDRAVLTRAAVDCGLDGALVGSLFEDGSDAGAVQEEISSAVRLGVSGVPFFIFDAKFAVPGAQAPEVLAAAIEKARHATAEVLPA